MAPHANSAWLDDQTLLCENDAGEVASLNVSTGQEGAFIEAPGVLARVGNRLVRRNYKVDSTMTQLFTVAIGGHDDETWLDIRPLVAINKLEFA